MSTWQKRPPKRWAAATVVFGAVTAVLASPLAIGTAAAATNTLTVNAASQNQNLPVGSTATFHLTYTGPDSSVYYTITNSSPAHTTNYPNDVAPSSQICDATPTGGTATCTITSDGSTTGTDVVEFFQDTNTVSPSPTNSTATVAAPTDLTFSSNPRNVTLTPTNKTSSTNTCVVYTLSATDATGLQSGNQQFAITVTETPNTATFTHYDANCTAGSATTGSSFNVTTGNNGTVQFGLASDTAGTGRITATATNGGAQAFANPVWTSGGANAVTQLAVSPPSTTDYVNSTEHFTVTALDANANPVQGVTVNEQATTPPATSPDLSTTAAGYPVSCGTTDQNGKVTCSVTNAGSAGTNTLTFWVNKTSPPSGCTSLSPGPDTSTACNEATATATATFNALPAVGSSASDFTLTCQDQTTANGGAQTDCTVPTSQTSVTWTATVKDTNGNPLSGVVVDFTATGAPVTAGTATPSSGQATTNSAGVATFTVNHPNASDGDKVSVTATIGDPAHGGFTAGPSTATWAAPVATALSLQPPAQSATTGSTISVTAQVVDQFGNGVSTTQHLVYTVTGRNTKAPTTITTNSSGSATITYTDTGTTGTTDTITVTDTDNPSLGLATATVQYVSSTTAATVTVDTSGPSPGPCGAAADHPKTGATFETVYPVCALVKNASGEVLAGKSVTFTVSNGRITGGSTAPGSIPSSAGTSVTVTTDANGVATAYATSDTTGVQTVTATTSDGATGSSTITYNAPAASTAMTITASPTNVRVEPGGSQKFTFTVTDQYGNGVPGVVVAVSQSGPGILTTGSGNQTTNSSGQVFALLTTQSNDTGSGSVTGNITNNTPANQCATTGGSCTATATYVVKSAPAHLRLSAETGAHAGTHETITATATNGDNTPAANQVVRFFISGANKGTATATTNASGQAQISYLARNKGYDTIKAYVDTNNDAIRTADEPAATTTAHIRGIPEHPTMTFKRKGGVNHHLGRVALRVRTHPRLAGAFIVYYEKIHGHWQRIGSAHTGHRGRAGRTFVVHSGKHKFRAKVKGTSTTNHGYTPVVRIRVQHT